MVGKTFTLALALIAVTLAGCSGDGGGGSETDDIPIDVNTADGKGAIVGVVLDNSLTPLVGATTVLMPGELEAQTNENGAFVFNDLELETDYFVTASKPGYSEVQQNVQATAAGKEPEIIKVLLERIPGTEPSFNFEKWSGFVECSVRVAGAGLNACAILPEDVSNQNTEYPMSFDRAPTMVQGELTWESTQSLGSGMTLVVGPETCFDVKYGRSDGAAPRVIRLNETALAAQNVGPEAGICFRVFNWHAEESADTFGLTVNQEFEVLITTTYNFEPAEEWTYINDGEPQVPT